MKKRKKGRHQPPKVKKHPEPATKMQKGIGWWALSAPPTRKLPDGTTQSMDVETAEIRINAMRGISKPDGLADLVAQYTELARSDSKTLAASHVRSWLDALGVPWRPKS